MHEHLSTDLNSIGDVLGEAATVARRFLAQLDTHPASRSPTSHPLIDLPGSGRGAIEAIHAFADRYFDELVGSAGPRFFGYVVGGATPAAIAGDWLTAAFDQDNGEGMTAQLETEAVHMLRQLLGIPTDHFGVLVTGATMANFVGLATARQWLGRERNVDVAREGAFGLGPIRVFSGAPHSSIYKALSMLGLGRDCVVRVNCFRDSEAVDPQALRTALERHAGEPCIIVGNAGTVNATSFDDFRALAQLREEYGSWLHVDGAFGLFAACCSRYESFVEGLGAADSVAVDAHKWLNVPYDCGALFTKHPELQRAVFVNASAAYLRDASDTAIDYMNRTPETSRRLRALPVWMTLMAYGRAGYREIVERDCAAARSLAARVEQSKQFRLLVPCTLNVVCFTLTHRPERSGEVLDALTAEGTAFMTPTIYGGIPGIRAAFCNWRTTPVDVEKAWDALVRLGDQSDG